MGIGFPSSCLTVFPVFGDENTGSKMLLRMSPQFTTFVLRSLNSISSEQAQFQVLDWSGFLSLPWHCRYRPAPELRPQLLRDDHSVRLFRSACRPPLCMWIRRTASATLVAPLFGYCRFCFGPWRGLRGLIFHQ